MPIWEAVYSADLGTATSPAELCVGTLCGAIGLLGGAELHLPGQELPSECCMTPCTQYNSSLVTSVTSCFSYCSSPHVFLTTFPEVSVPVMFIERIQARHTERGVEEGWGLLQGKVKHFQKHSFGQ